MTLTPLEVLTLAGLSDRPRYGYELVERIEALSAGRVGVRPGNLYRVIHRLAERGLIREVAVAGDEAADERRQYFQATEEGRRQAARELRMYAEVLETLPALGELGATGDA